MKRSEINQVIQEAKIFFEQNGWTLPPHPRWDVTDFGLGNFKEHGLVLVNLCEEPEYCEKLMYAEKKMCTPSHTHAKKKEDIICRTGELAIQVWSGKPSQVGNKSFEIQINQVKRIVKSGDILLLHAGERVTLISGIYHAFWPESEACIIGEVSTANDDLNDNFFEREDIGRYAHIEEDEPAVLRLLSDPAIV